MSVKRKRLDQLLVEKGLMQSRARARDAIKRKTVQVDGKIEPKAARLVPEDANIILNDPAQHYVARSALKLIKALDEFSIDLKSKNVLDIGASTGGFTQVLLERGAAHVIAIDVGHDQLHETLLKNTRVTALEGINAKDIEEENLNPEPDIITMDVSFISITKIIPHLFKICDTAKEAVLLFKPQFEVGKENLGKGGIARNHKAIIKAREKIEHVIHEAKWRVSAVCDAPIQGGDGNQEQLIYALKKAAL